MAVRLRAGQYPRSRDSPAPTHLATLREAIWDERAVEITYRDKAGTDTRRRIWLLSVVFLDRSLLCLAFCQLRQVFRRFHLSMMADLTPLSESFRPRRVALLRQMLAEIRASDAGREK